METQRLTASQVKLGEPLPGNVYDDTEHLLLSAGFVIADPAVLQSLLERGMYMDVTTFNTHYGALAGIGETPQKSFDPFQIRDSLKKRLNRVLRTLHEIDDGPAQIAALAAVVGHLAATDAEGAVAAGILDTDESHAIRHAVQCAVLCELATTTLGWPESQRLSLACAAMTMNLGMLDIQDRLAGQETPLTPQQREAVRQHPEKACDALRRAGVTDALWLACVKEHHERSGGNGYPAQLAHPCEASQALRIVDAFGALMSARGDRRPQTPPQAIRTLLAEEGHGVHAEFVGALVKAVGVIPPGTFVKLANHEAAVVHRHGSAPNAPHVFSVTSGSGNRYMKPVARDTQNKDIAIAGLLARDKVSVGYDLATLWVTHPR